MIERMFIPYPNHPDRGIQVYLPASYESVNYRYPTLYLHDGLNVFRDNDAIGGVSLGLENYLDENQVEMIVVAIDSNPGERSNEYCPWQYGEYSKRILGDLPALGGGGEEYANFIVHTVKPLIETKYRTQPEHSFIGGISLGGLITTFLAARYSGLFRRVAVLSPAYYPNQEKIEELISASDWFGTNGFYLDCGTKEAGENEELSGIFLASAQSVCDVLKEKMLNARFERIENGGHSYSDIRKRVPDMISFLLAEA